MITRDPFSVTSMYKAATSFINRNGDTVDISPYGRADEYGMNAAQLRHLDPSDSFSVYDDMDVEITIGSGDNERTQLIRVPSPAKQWRYWDRRMNGGDA